MNEILKGTVVHGKRLGRTIGFPTANLAMEEVIPCAGGVYYGTAQVDDVLYRVILNIGSHPTVPEGPPTVEAHLIDFSGDLYGRELSVRVRAFMRAETRFPSVDALRAQLERDKAAARVLPLE